MHWVRRFPRRTLVAVVVAWLCGLISHGHHGGEGDAPHYMIIARSIAYDGDLDVSNNYGVGSPLIYDGHLEPDEHARWIGRHLRPVHDAGMPFLLAPGFRLAYGAAQFLAEKLPPAWMRGVRLTPSILLRHLLSLQMIALAAALALVLLALFQTLSIGADRAVVAAALCILSPPLLPVGFAFLTELPSALIAAYVYLKTRRPGSPSTTTLLTAAALCGLLPLIHIRNAGLSLALIVVAMTAWRHEPPRRLMTLLATYGTVLMVRALLTHALWGSWVTTPHAQVGRLGEIFSAATLSTSGERLTGLLVDREHGLLPVAPMFIPVCAGVLLMLQRERATAVQLLLIIACYLAPVLNPSLNVHGWRGGWSPAARFLVPMTPFMAMFAVYAWRSVRHRSVLTGLIAVQVILDTVFWSRPKLLWEEGDGVSKLFALASRTFGVDFNRILPSVPPAPSPDMLSTTMFLLVWCTLTLILVFDSRRHEEGAA